MEYERNTNNEFEDTYIETMMFWRRGKTISNPNKTFSMKKTISKT